MRRAILGLGEAGAGLLVLAQFLALYSTHVATQRGAVGSGNVGSANAFGVLAVGLLAGALVWFVWLDGARFALALVGVLGLVALVIALGHDLSVARASGLRLVHGQYETASNVVGVGLYVEIAGALLLLGAAVVGFLLARDGAVAGGPAVGGRAGRRRAGPSAGR